MQSRIGFLIFTAAVTAAAQQSPTFRVGTQLVQVSVVAEDKQGKPVADLQREDFRIFDNGMAQEIRLFLAETEKSNQAAPEAQPLNKTPNTFTNQIASRAVSHTGYSVILIDNLFADFGDPITQEEGSGLAGVRTLQMLQSIPAGEKVAIYPRGLKLHIIGEFTSDRDLLERQLRVWKPDVDTPATNGEILGDGAHVGDASDKARVEATRIDTLRRASASNEGFDLIADHLAGIPGRKNMIWLSNRFVISPRSLQRLNQASVSIYPVDLDGVCRLCSPRPVALMRDIASQSGGVAYYLRNDIDIAMREAMDDGRVSYTLGFYPSAQDRAVQTHQLAVQVGRPGVSLRYRTTYQSQPAQPVSNPKADLIQALNRPIDATAIPIKASVTRVQDRLNLQAALDMEGLNLVLERSLWTGKIEVVGRFTAADGTIAGEGFSQTMVLNLRQETYDKALRDGLPYRNELKIPAKAVELKLLFADLATGKIGTLSIPLSDK